MSEELYEGKTDHDLLIEIHTIIKTDVAGMKKTLYAKPEGICAEVAVLKGKYSTLKVIGGIIAVLLPIASGVAMWVVNIIIK